MNNQAKGPLVFIWAKPFLVFLQQQFGVLGLGILLLAGCIPDGGADKKTATCNIGQEYDAVTKSCKGVIQPTDQPPVPRTNSATIVEDAGVQVVNLDYSDVDGNWASSCVLSSVANGIDDAPPSCSCVGGICTILITPDSNFAGTTGLNYVLSDVNGSSGVQALVIYVSQANDTPTISAITDRTGGSAGTEDTMLSVAGISIDEGGGIYENDQNLTVMVTSANTTVLPQNNIVVRYNGVDIGFNGVTPVTIPSLVADAGASTLTLELTPAANENTNISGPFAVSVTVTDSLFAMVATNFNVEYTAVNDVPVNALSNITLVEDTVDSKTLTYSDADGELATSCSVATFSYLLQYSSCACVAGVCSFSLHGSPNFYSTSTLASFEYSVNAGGQDSATTTVYATVTAVNDAPMASPMAAAGANVDANGNVLFTESTSSSGTTVSFDLLAGYDEEGSSLTYALVSAPSNGTLANCLGLNGSTNTDLSCDYTPTDGNLSGIGTAASGTLTDIEYTSKIDGAYGSTIQVTYLDTPSITAGNEIAYASGTSIYVLIDAGNSTNSQIETAIDSKVDLARMISTNVLIGGTTPAAGTLTLTGGIDGADFFTYKTNDGTVDSAAATININITPVNDSPVICEFTKYVDAPECGLNGCIGSQTPMGNITPHAANVYYYNDNTAACWKSTGTTSSSWQLVASNIANVLVNEKEKIIIDSVRVDEGGGDATEDAQTLQITGATSSNTVLLPNANIRFYYNNALTAVGATFGSGASEDLDDFRIEMIPVGGQSGASTVQVGLRDSAGTTVIQSFTVTVNNVSVLHGGWKNISAVGPKVNKYDQVKDAAYVCNFSLTKCNGGSICTGSGSPTGTYTADDANVVYYDSSNDQCYYSSTSTNAAWVSFDAYCNISPSDWASECSALGASCIGSNSPTSLGLTPTGHNNFFYDATNDVCYRSTDTSAPTDWQVYSAPAKVTIEWSSFTVSGSGTIVGWNIYRRLSQVGATSYSFDYDWPINKSMLAAGSTSYTDNSTNSWFAPIPGTVYFYEVRPVIQVGSTNIPTDTNEVFKTIRLIAPPENMSFVHRWIVNKEICAKHGASTDANDNFSCLYEGFGSSANAPSAGTNVYDIGEDLLVDSFEAGCPYASSPNCNTLDGSCIGLSAPNGSITGSSAGIAYYNRSNGKCYINTNGASAWSEYTSVTSTYNTLADFRKAELPPIVHVSQDDADGFCDNAQDVQNVLGLSTDPEVKLPSRKQQRAFALWDDVTNTDASIETYEAGLSLNGASRCNTVSANGLTSSYTDTNAPDSNSLFSLPGSNSSGIRSMMTGSTQTASCSSRFKVQDHIGNVAEWVTDRMNCRASTPSFSSCSAIINGDSFDLDSGNTSDDLQAGDGSDDIDRYRLGMLSSDVVGPCIDGDGDGICDTELTSWKLEDELYGARAMSMAMGLPTRSDLLSTFPSSDVVGHFKDIGPTTGITNDQLHEDSVIFNSDVIFSERNGCGAMSAGGGYLTGTGAGMYHIEMVPCTNTAYGHLKVQDIAIRDISGGSLNSVEVIASATSTYVVNSANLKVFVAAGDDASDVVTVINAGSTFARASVGGDSAGTISAQAQTSVEHPSASNKRVDLGFRCLAPVPSGNYTE